MIAFGVNVVDTSVDDNNPESKETGFSRKDLSVFSVVLSTALSKSMDMGTGLEILLSTTLASSIKVVVDSLTMEGSLV